MKDQWSTPEIKKKFESYGDRFFKISPLDKSEQKNRSNETLLLQERQEENSDFWNVEIGILV